ncbi:MAG: S41 family peptidase, partial [Candidatus Fimimonas sp.]
PGGLVDAVCDIAGMLVCDQKLSDSQKSQVTRGSQLLITSLVDRNDNKQVSYRTSFYNNYFDAPAQNGVCDIVVWTDGNSASASELLTGALRDYGTGFQIGSKTYGKGIAQTYEPLPYTGQIVKTDGTLGTGHWAIYYTFAAYYSPLGENIHGTGYTPTEGYDGIDDYATLWQKTLQYWGE